MEHKVKKILIVNYEYPPLGGGGGVATYDLAVEWAKTCQVDVLTSSFAGLPSFETSDNVNIHRVRILFRTSRDAATFVSMASFVFFGFFRGISIIRKNRYDVMNTHFAVPTGPLGYILSRIFRIPNVLSLHGGDIYDPSKKLSPHKSPVFRRVVDFILKKADVLVAQSGNTRDNAMKYYNINKEIRIIPLPYHPPVMPKKDRKKLGIGNNDYVITTLGRVIKRKAIDVAIRAIAEVKDKKVRLYVMGDGPEKENLQNLAAELNVSDRVIFLGFVDDKLKYSYLGVSDLFMMTSLHEGFGIVFMEAMFAGIPIVCTNHGGQTDFLFHGKNALMIDVGDVENCRKSIEKIKKDSRMASAFSAYNKKAVKKFYADSVAAQYIDIFNSLNGARSGL